AGSWPRRLTAVAYKNTSAMCLDEADRVLDGHDLLGRVIGDFAAEFLLEGHHQLDRIEAVCPQIVDKAGILGHLGLVDAEMLDEDLLDPFGDVAHSLFPRLHVRLIGSISAVRAPKRAQP